MVKLQLFSVYFNQAKIIANPTSSITVTSFIKAFGYTVKPVYNDYPWDPKIVAVVDRLSLIRGSFIV